MAQYQLTISDDILKHLLNNEHGLATLVEQVLDQVLDAQVSEYLKANPYERTEERQGYRNGYRDRGLLTRVGRLSLAVPQVRNGNFTTDFLKDTKEVNRLYS